MKKLLAISILCALLFQCLAHYSVIGLYALRRDYIAAHLCENRDRPELRCCGKCYLRKQLRKVDGSQDDPKGRIASKPDKEAIVYILPDPPALPVHATAAAEDAFNPGRQRLKGRLPDDPVFRPPAGCRIFA